VQGSAGSEGEGSEGDQHGNAGNENDESEGDSEDESEDENEESDDHDPLVGRLLELVAPAVLAPLAAARATNSGGAARASPLALVFGAAGVGKTTLVATLARRLGLPPLAPTPSLLEPPPSGRPGRPALPRPAFPAVACEWVACSALVGAPTPHVLASLERACANAARRAPCLLVLDDLDALVPSDAGESLEARPALHLPSPTSAFDLLSLSDAAFLEKNK
jgi:hypothetical protein